MLQSIQRCPKGIALSKCIRKVSQNTKRCQKVSKRYRGVKRCRKMPKGVKRYPKILKGSHKESESVRRGVECRITCPFPFLPVGCRALRIDLQEGCDARADDQSAGLNGMQSRCIEIFKRKRRMEKDRKDEKEEKSGKSRDEWLSRSKWRPRV